MNIEEFELSNIPKRVGIDDTDDYRTGMPITFIGHDKSFIIMDVLNQYELTVLEVGILH